MSEDIDPENLDSFSIPESLLEQLFEFSGSGDHSKGFILAFVTQQGKPLVYTKAQNQIVEMGLRKSLEKYLIGVEEAESMFNMGDDEPELGLD
jgi:hypothetical protein|tara:strand:- start:171 stop:449 length:279 start_codon:yes stop_codon:yes gene_type:complete